MTVVQNDSIADVKNDVAQECVNNIFSEVMKFDHYSDLAHDIAASIAVEVSFNLKREPKLRRFQKMGK